MTDFTTDAPVRARRRHHRNQIEYRVYFLIIFMAALPTTLLVWLLSGLHMAKRPEHGPIRSAWTQARIITPKIFWA